MKIIKKISYFILLIILLHCNNNQTNKNPIISTKTIPLINYSVERVFPHDTNSFTEGLFVDKSKIFESTGSPEELPRTQSTIGVIDTNTGKLKIKVLLERKKYFGEGITILNDKIYQLTYVSNTGFVYDAATFKKIKEFKFANKEGWGLATDGINLIMSDGTNKLTFISPFDFKIQYSISVFDNNEPLKNLNELEFINGYIYANVFTTDYIVKIDPTNGIVIGKLDLSSLGLEARNQYPGSLEMNGIAFDSIKNKIFITGKMWPNIYEIIFSH